MTAVRRALTSFPVRSLLILTLLLLPWPGVARAFAATTADVNQAVLGNDSSLRQISFRLPRPNESANSWEVLAIARERDSTRQVGTAIDVRRAGYLQDATFVALTLATRLRRRTKVLILAIGLGALQLVPLLPALAFFSRVDAGVQVFALSSLSQWLVEIAYRSLIAAPGMAYALGGLLWLLLVRLFAREALWTTDEP
jgi:hypothetical protein